MTALDRHLNNPASRPEVRKKISETIRRKIALGIIIPPFKKGMVSLNKGKHHTEETKRKIGLANSISLKGHRPGNYVDGRSHFKSPMRYGDDWDKIRYLVYLRDKFTCQSCGVIHERLDVHHIKPFIESGDNSLENLISLCRSCHMKEDNRLRKILLVVKKNG